MSTNTANRVQAYSRIQLWVLSTLCLSLSGCGLLEVNPDKPAEEIRGTWSIIDVRTQTFEADGTVTSDETVTDMGTLQFLFDVPLPPSGIPGLDLGERDGLLAPAAFLRLFRPSQELQRRGAATVFLVNGESIVGVQWGRLDRRLVFSGYSGPEQRSLSYVATTTLDGDQLTLLYVEADHPLDTFGMSYRQEVQLRRQ
ncbi:MAG: hypothetical protein RhofKO_04540 [Rhodothermales bacterium]